jgi:hypothetical protein
MYARHRLDIGLADLVPAAAGRGGRAPLPPAGGLDCLSVRSGFHLLLCALGLPPGGEVVFSALTHPDLPRLVEHHGLVAVPADLDLDTLAPRPASLEAAISPRTRLVVVAHLFGGLVDLTPAAELARRAGALLVEDCAQAYAGPGQERDPLADVSMFSFGLLKTATAAGGARLLVRDERLLARMAAVQAGWPAQPEGAYRAKVARTAAFVAAGRPLPYGLLAGWHRVTGRDLDAWVNGAVRSFRAATGAELVGRLERRPCDSLARTIDRRLATFDAGRLARRAAAGEAAMALLPPGLRHPGDRMLRRTHWLFPVVADDPDALVAAARAAGFDAARAASNLHAVPAPPGRPDLAPSTAAGMLSRLVYLPMYPEIPERERRRLLTAVLGGLGAARPVGVAS